MLEHCVGDESTSVVAKIKIVLARQSAQLSRTCPIWVMHVQTESSTVQMDSVFRSARLLE